jgi:hypothetical protein
MCPVAVKMSDDPTQFAVQIHLAEFAALRQELLDVLKWRDGLLFASLGISGALFSFALSSTEAEPNQLSSRYLALYLISPLAAVICGLWMSNSWRAFRIGRYIRDFIAPKLNALVVLRVELRAADFEVFRWESSAERVLGEWGRRILDLGVLLSVFVLAGTGAQFLLLSEQTGPLRSRIESLAFPFWFELNCILLFASLILVFLHFLAGREHYSFPRKWRK